MHLYSSDYPYLLLIHESHRNVGSTVWDGLVFIPILAAALFATYNLISASRKTDLVILTVGLQLLALWYFLHIIDGIIRIKHDPPPKKYALAISTFWAVRVLSDVFILWGLIRLSGRFGFYTNDGRFRRIVDFATAVPLFLGLFHVGLLFSANLSAWDAGAGDEADAWATLANGHLILGAVFYTVQFLGAGVAGHLVWADYSDHPKTRSNARSIFMSWKPGVPNVTPRAGDGNPVTHFKTDQTGMCSLVAVGGCFFLAFRAFCEVIIAGEAHRNTSTEGKFIKNHEARCVLYGLASAPMAVCFCFAMFVAGEDFIALAQEEGAGNVRGEVRRRLAAETHNGTRTAPELGPILDALHIRTGQQTTRIEAELRNRTRNDFVKRLEHRYKGWTPIFKQDQQE